jgi:uncharacterized protein (TIGR03032 family)
MRLETPFVRLPLELEADELISEVAALDPGVWRAHPEGAPGNTAVPLVAVDGDPANDSTSGEMRPTPHLARLPYVSSVIAALGSVIGRTRLMRIEEEGELAPHVDLNYYWRDHLRVHAPILTTPDVEFECGGRQVHMAAGEVWVFDTWRPHLVRNPARAPRVHLVIDTVGSEGLWDLIAHPDRPHRRVELSAAGARFPTEAVNRPSVMTPWEVEWSLERLLTEAGHVDAKSAAPLRAALTGWLHAWREAWARYGDRADGRTEFEQLRARAEGILGTLAGGVTLPNGASFSTALRHHVLEPAIDARAKERRDAGQVPTQVAPSRPVIDRPIFVVSSPRSGSSLLFETLARAPGLATIGGESHMIIESIPALRPAAHGWESNRLTADDATTETVATLAQQFIAELRDRDGRPPMPGPVRMLEKTPKNSLRVPFLATAFPDGRFVYLYRDPRETVSSMLDAWRSGRFVMYPDLPGWEGDPWSLLLVPGWRALSGRPLAEVVARQWARATTVLLDDLEALDPDRWCVASYDRLLADPRAEIERLCEFCELDWDDDLSDPLPLSRHTLDSPQPDKWRRNADELAPFWDDVRDVAVRAHDVFAAPPRIKPVRRPPSPNVTIAPEPAAPVRNGGAVPVAEPVSFESIHTGSFPELLDALDASLLVSTYQSGRVIVVRTDGDVLNTHFRLFQVPMGMAARAGELAIGGKAQVYRLQNQPALTARLEPPGKHDACFVSRSTHSTGDIRIHDMAYAGDELWAVNTRFSCLCTFDDQHSFVPRWRPPFVTGLAPEDRCHLNGMAIVDEAPRYVTALGTTDTEGGWRENKASGGVLMHVPSGEVVVDGLCMPHSPRWYDNRLWMLESGNGALGYVDLERGVYEEVTRLPGFTRGLSFVGPFAFVGLSQVRENVFDGIPLRAEGVERSCGVWAIDLRTGTTAAFLRFEGIVQELFEVLPLPGVRYPEIVEPGAELLESAFVLSDDAMADVVLPARE